MSETVITTPDATPTKPLLPWFVKVSPEFYDDACDTGFGWEGWAVDSDDAIRQALEDCSLTNDREPDNWEDDVDPNRAKVHVAEIDFRQFAGPLLHWARSIGGVDTPLWRLFEVAVHEAGLTVAPLARVGDDPSAVPPPPGPL